MLGLQLGRIRFSVCSWLISVYLHVFVLHSVVNATLPFLKRPARYMEVSGLLSRVMVIKVRYWHAVYVLNG